MDYQSSSVSAEMPRYRCHKEVWALKIKALNVLEDGSEVYITPADAGYGTFAAGRAYYDKHKPEVGGYYVVYADGYKSYSPAEAFEDGYSRVN